MTGLTDVVFSSASAVDRITTADRLVATDDDEDRFLHWLESGGIAYDRCGRLRRAQTKVRLAGWAVANRADDSYSRLFSANYNLAQTRRYATADDPPRGRSLVHPRGDQRRPGVLGEPW